MDQLCPGLLQMQRQEGGSDTGTDGNGAPKSAQKAQVDGAVSHPNITASDELGSVHFESLLGSAARSLSTNDPGR